jgi:hypothetical protein
MSGIARLMLLIVRVGVDLAKNLIHVHAVDAAGRKVVGRAFKRDQFFAWCEQLPAGCVVAMEACSSAHDPTGPVGCAPRVWMRGSSQPTS